MFLTLFGFFYYSESYGKQIWGRSNLKVAAYV